MTRLASGVPAARKNRGHPRREARRQRAAERLALHVHHALCRPANRPALTAPVDYLEGVSDDPA